MKANYYVVNWMYHEYGWGASPDGESFHKTREDAKKFIEQILRENRQSGDKDFSYPSPDVIYPIIADDDLLNKIGDSLGYRIDEDQVGSVKYTIVVES